jgi:hypothetical protein
MMSPYLADSFDISAHVVNVALEIVEISVELRPLLIDTILHVKIRVHRKMEGLHILSHLCPLPLEQPCRLTEYVSNDVSADKVF